MVGSYLCVYVCESGDEEAEGGGQGEECLLNATATSHGHWRMSGWSERHQHSRPPRHKIQLKITTHVSAKVPLTNAWVNDVFPTARNPRMATLRCTMAGSFFGIVQPKMCHYAVQRGKAGLEGGKHRTTRLHGGMEWSVPVDSTTTPLNDGVSPVESSRVEYICQVCKYSANASTE